jgi:hypothetical protein
MKFFPVFTLRVTHSYYTDGRCSDFLIELSRETERFISKHRCIVRSLPDGVQVLTAVDENKKPFIAFPDEMKFTFHLRLQNPDFALFTDLSDINHRVAPLYTNTGLGSEDGRQLRLDSRTAWHTERFVVFQPAPGEHFTLGGRPLAGLELSAIELEGSGKVKLKEYNSNDKIITVDSRSALPGETFAITYPIEPRLERGVYADVEIYNHDSLLAIEEGPVEFQIAFSAKQARWKYYFITDLKSTADGFRIVNADPASEVSVPVFGDENRRYLNQDPDPQDDLAKELAEQYPKMQRFRFVSDDLVACRQAARKYLELHMDDNRLFGAIPNPSIRNYSKTEAKAEATLHPQDALFHVVKYITQPFPKRGV